MSQVKIFALGGLDEDGKNMYLVEDNNEIFILEAGSKYPDEEQLGVEIIIPDFSYLQENKNKIKGIFITHGHDDALGALSYLVKQIHLPIYTTALTAKIIEANFKKNQITNYKLHVIERSDSFKIGKREIRTFGLTMSIPDAFGVAINTSQGYVVYTSEFLFDFDNKIESFSCDVLELAELGKENILCLLNESTSAGNGGFTAPGHKITSLIDAPFMEADERIIITAYEQNIYRVIEIIELAERLKKRIFFHDDGLRNLMIDIEKLGYYKLPAGIEILKGRFSNDFEDVVVIVSGRGPQVFRKMFKIATGEDETVRLNANDTVIIGSPVAAGSEVEAAQMENELYKENIKVISVSKKAMFSLHASAEDLKMMIYFLKPTYYMPVKGEYRHLIDNANIALNRGFYADKILVLDNGQIATFENGKLADMATVLTLEDVLIDGSENLDASGFVLRDRLTLSTDGVIVVGVVIDYKTKTVIGGPDVQSRGLIYMKDADYITTEIGDIMENTIANAVAENRYENMGARMEAKDAIMKYLLKETGKRPMILPAIIEINVAVEE